MFNYYSNRNYSKNYNNNNQNSNNKLKMLQVIVIVAIGKNTGLQPQVHLLKRPVCFVPIIRPTVTKISRGVQWTSRTR